MHVNEIVRLGAKTSTVDGHTAVVHGVPKQPVRRAR